MPENLIVDGDDGTFNDSVDPAGDPPSDWDITKQVYSGGTPENQGGTFLRKTVVGALDPFEGAAFAQGNFSGGALPLGLIKGWAFDTAVVTVEDSDYIIEGWFAFIGGSSNYNDSIKPFLFPDGFALEDLEIESQVVGTLTADVWTRFSVKFNSGSNTSIDLILGGDSTVASASGGGNTVGFDLITMNGPLTDVTLQDKKICIRKPCANPFFVKWLNSLGGWSYWMFDYNQDEKTTPSKPSIIGQRVVDISMADQFTKTIGDTEIIEYKCRAVGVNDNEYEALTEIGASKQIYRMFEDGSQIGLKRKRMNAVRRTKDAGHVIELIFTIPQKLFQTE